MSDSPSITQALQVIESVKNKPQKIDYRKSLTIDLAALILEEANNIRTSKEIERQVELAGMIKDPIGKVFVTIITDQCFRSHWASRIANQMSYTIQKFGIPEYLSRNKKIQLKAFQYLGKPLSPILVPLAIKTLRREVEHVILPGESKPLSIHINKRYREGVRINLNRIGEAILGEEEAENRLRTYLDDLARPEVEYISIKISTICSQLNLLSWNDTLEILSGRLRRLYSAAVETYFLSSDGQYRPKFINLDMEEYHDLHLTVALFRKVLDEPEFFQYSAGIVLQAYLPDSYLIQQELTLWAMQRVINGGAPIKIRIVKGANLAMEQVDAALHQWPQAPYTSKTDVDSNFKRMVNYGFIPEHAKAVHLGISTHNLFDIAYAILLRAENCIEKEVSFEMLEGMADPVRRVVQKLTGDVLLYCPTATKREFQNAIAYLVRRLDENTSPQNFLSHSFNLHPGSPDWNEQACLFSQSCDRTIDLSYFPRRTQNRLEQQFAPLPKKFQNEPDTDWSLSQNRKWAEKMIKIWQKKEITPIPLVIDGREIYHSRKMGVGIDPSHPKKTLYTFSLASENDLDSVLSAAKCAEKGWSTISVQKRSLLLEAIALGLKQRRGDLIGAMVANAGKTVVEADMEVSEAIDFAEYYRRNAEEWYLLEDISWKSKGTVVVAPPWNFPCSIPTGGILAALATGNCVIFKPASEVVLIGWLLAQIFWEAGIGRDVLQFITCEDEPVGSSLIKDPRVNAVILTGATATAKFFLNLRPGLDLIAETGGKNTMIVTGLADRDLAIKDIIQSAFGHAGQKCSACSLAILEAEVYDDPHFRKQLRDAAKSLKVGSPWNLQTKLGPLMSIPNPTLWRGLTVLEKGEEWLLKPEQDGNNPHLWSPGIKMGVTQGSFSHQNELFGPVLGLMRAKDLKHALTLANGTRYGLTAGIHSLDEREQSTWIDQIEAGNCYINRGITGAIVERQPFGGCKESSFGKGMKAGGPNYICQLMHAIQNKLPKEREEEGAQIQLLTKTLDLLKPTSTERELWAASVGSYTFFWKRYFRKEHDPSLILGQDNILKYVPHRKMSLRMQKNDTWIDILRIVAASVISGTSLEISGKGELFNLLCMELKSFSSTSFIEETEQGFIAGLTEKAVKRVRLASTPSKELTLGMGQAACRVHSDSVLANGRIELLHYIREVSISRSYHRYGNLGSRESEKRAPLPNHY